MHTTRALAFAAALLTGVACSSSSNGSSPSPAPPAVSAIALGGWYTCAISTSGAVRCWGENAHGALGNPAGLGQSSFTPVLAASVAAPAQLAAGNAHACARAAAGTVGCWGYGLHGQLGNGLYDDSITPVIVSSVASAVHVAAGSNHSCAATTAGAVRCWGRNDFGQLGDPAHVPTTGPDNRSADPVTVSSVSGATAVAAGGLHSCALLAAGSVKCWGGLFDGPPPYDPVAITSLANVTAIAAGYFHTCALVNGGAVKCWGGNSRGQLGNGAPGHSPTEAVFATGIASATAVAAGMDHACALLAGGTVACWGSNNRGQLGDGTYTDRSTPVAVAGLTGATAVGAANSHSCALVAGGQVKCWGDNLRGELAIDPALVQTSTVPLTIPL